jgi:hypothetical protein
MKDFVHYRCFQPQNIVFTMGVDRQGKNTVNMTHGPAGLQEVALVTAPAVTLWPRVSGDGNFGTMWGPTDISKAKFTLDLNDARINDMDNEEFQYFKTVLEAIDDLLLDYVTENQLKILGRKNLSRDEVKMLQIRSIRPKVDKMSGVLTGHTLNLSTTKYAWDGLGGKHERKIAVCDYTGKAIPNGRVAPGDVVAATIYANQVYTGVGGDKFGIHWTFQDISVVCQRGQLEEKAEVHAFSACESMFAKAYDSELVGNAA